MTSPGIRLVFLVRERIKGRPFQYDLEDVFNEVPSAVADEKSDGGGEISSEKSKPQLLGCYGAQDPDDPREKTHCQEVRDLEAHLFIGILVLHESHQPPNDPAPETPDKDRKHMRFLINFTQQAAPLLPEEPPPPQVSPTFLPVARSQLGSVLRCPDL